jgi:hypothetical protein
MAASLALAREIGEGSKEREVRREERGEERGVRSKREE